MGFKKLVKYYPRIHTHLGTVGTILDPRLKFAYHHESGWSQQEIRDATRMVQAYYSEYEAVWNASMEEKEACVKGTFELLRFFRVINIT
jgi:hypothetical protein